MTEGQSKFEGWAIVEMMGHRKEIGFVTTENYGAAALFRVDTPGLPEREFILKRPEYVRVDSSENGSNSQWCAAGSMVKREAMPSRSVLVGPGSVYALNPCTEEAARAAIESMTSRPLILLKLPDAPQLNAGDPVQPDPAADYENDSDADVDGDDDF